MCPAICPIPAKNKSSFKAQSLHAACEANIEPRAWSSSDWTSSDDRVRNGSSQSYLIIASDYTTANFSGVLDTKTLGGAGFASQRTTGENKTWDVSAYDGIELDVVKGDGKRYTFTIKNELLPPSGDGREQSTISWEFDFVVGGENATVKGNNEKVFIAWQELKPMYRGREKPDADPLDLKSVRRFSLMMRSFFAQQEGQFELVVSSISAVKRKEKRYKDDPQARVSMDDLGEKRLMNHGTKEKQSWASWVFGGCGIL